MPSAATKSPRNSKTPASSRTELALRLSTPFALAMLGALLFWLSLPPVDWWPLGWIAPIPWLLLVRIPELSAAPAETERAKRFWRRWLQALSPRRPYVALWWAGFVFWLLAIHWLRYPHPLTHFGWLALAFYLSFYVPVFVAVARVAVHSLHVPLLLAAPIVWTGLEFARAHLLTGFLMGALGHTQYRWIELIQISDLAGAYAVSFVVMFVAACLARMWQLGGERIALWPILPLWLVLLGTLVYGYIRTSDPPLRPGPTVALIQGSIAPNWKQEPGRAREIFKHYLKLSQQALAENAKYEAQIDLLVWPETMYRQTLLELATDFQGPAEDRDRYEGHAQAVRSDLRTLAEHLNVPLLLGIDAVHMTKDRRLDFNSAIFVERNGKIVARYDKMHRVMFGEYVPFAEWFPALYELTPLTGGIAAGRGPQSIEINGVRYSPNICYETVIPQVIRRQVLDARAAGAEPDILVNLTNDAWFRGSSELDMHLACDVFRAVECRKPLLVAANEGISAQIDGDGRIEQRLPKRSEGFLLLRHVPLEERRSLYLDHVGDVPAGACLTLVAFVSVWGVFAHWRCRKVAKAEKST